MNKRSIFAAIVGLIMISMFIAPAFAKGPSNAKMGQNGNGMWEYYEGYDAAYNPMADMCVGLDYGVGSTETYTTDGYYIGVIEAATLMDKGHYFSEGDEPYSDKDWVYYKFWLTSPEEIFFPDGSTYIATQFIFIKVHHSSDGTSTITLQAYK